MTLSLPTIPHSPWPQLSNSRRRYRPPPAAATLPTPATCRVIAARCSSPRPHALILYPCLHIRRSRRSSIIATIEVAQAIAAERAASTLASVREFIGGSIRWMAIIAVVPCWQVAWRFGADVEATAAVFYGDEATRLPTIYTDPSELANATW